MGSVAAALVRRRDSFVDALQGGRWVPRADRPIRLGSRNSGRPRDLLTQQGERLVVKSCLIGVSSAPLNSSRQSVRAASSAMSIALQRVTITIAPERIFLLT
jgi:hypothetical protein